MLNKGNKPKSFEMGKKRALYILAKSDRTEEEIKQKLRKNQYEEEVIIKVIEFLNEYGYLNDYNYAITYVNEKINYRSVMQIRSTLKFKGLSVSLIDEVLKEVSVDQTETIKNLIIKKNYRSAEKEEVDRNKLYSYLMRKGFKSSEITRAFKEIEGDIK